jgi:hypothetical protein
VHLNDILNHLISQVSEIFRTHIIEEAYCLPHQLQQFEAAV